MSDVTTEELARRLGEDGLVVLDVRSEGEFHGTVGYPCDARQGHVPGAVHIDVDALVGAAGPEAVRELVGAPEGAEIIAYCHSGGRSAFAVQVLRAAGYDARNYGPSWHEWSANADLPVE